MNGTISLSLDGVTDLPAGKLANVVTFLERNGPPPALSSRADLSVRQMTPATVAWYRAIYRRVGENWLWMSRAAMNDAALAALLAEPTQVVLALEDGGKPIGLAELDFSEPETAEIVTFGVVPEATGKGCAGYLMGHTLAACAARGAIRVWLHTCTLDHPAALRFYQKQGFRAFKRAVEVSDDPRATGVLPPDAAPNVPLIRAATD